MVNRRAFIKRCFALYGSLLLMPACKNEIGRLQYRCFSIDESECLGAICEQFIPTDEYWGAKEAGVVNFIDKLLYQRFPELEPDYKKGIQALEKYSVDVFQKTFANLSWEQQYAVLQQMERKELPEIYWEEIPQKKFFDMVLRNTMQGYYGSPRHGGNRDYVSFRMMRLDYPLLVGQNRYE